MYMEILNRLDKLNTKIDICCGNYDKAAENIQRSYRGFTSRRNTRRTMKPNITESLLNMPGDFSQMITDKVSELKHKETIGWTIFKNADAFTHNNPKTYSGTIEESIKNIEKYNGFTYISKHMRAWYRPGDINDIIKNIVSINTEKYTNINPGVRDWKKSLLFIKPGASLELIKQKINEGFEVEFEDERDKIAMDKLMKGGKKHKKGCKKHNKTKKKRKKLTKK